jgi:hypothetical protein
VKLTDWLNAINMKRGKPMEDPLAEKQYSPFIVNKCLSYFPDTILQVNEMNRYHHLDKKMQFDYLNSSVRKRKRFSPWMRKNKDKKIELVQKFFPYSAKKAEEILDLLSKECIQEMKNKSYTGGPHK